MRTRRVLFPALLVAVGAACHRTPPPTANAAFEADLIARASVASHRLEVELVIPGKECIELASDAHGTVDGRPLAVKERGGKKTGVYGHTNPTILTDCVMPVLALDDTRAIEAAPETTIDVVDGPRHARATFQALFAPRTFTVDRPKGSTVHVGDSLVVTWSPGTDRVNRFVLDKRTPITPGGMRITGTPSDAGPGSYVVVVPAVWMGTGDVRMQDTIVPGSTRCEGAKSCNGVVTTTLEGWPLVVAN